MLLDVREGNEGDIRGPVEELVGQRCCRHFDNFDRDGTVQAGESVEQLRQNEAGNAGDAAEPYDSIGGAIECGYFRSRRIDTCQDVTGMSEEGLTSSSEDDW